MNFGGVGVMVNAPRTEIEIRPAQRFAVDAADRSLVIRAARRWLRHLAGSPGITCSLRQLPVAVRITTRPPTHSGLGSGTQLALAVANGLSLAFGLDCGSPADWAGLTGRGRRSWIGLYGFGLGGLIVERGRYGTGISPLDCRWAVPSPWRILLARLDGGQRISGRAERQAFAQLGSSPHGIRAALTRIVCDSMIPSLVANDFDAFSHSVGAYSSLAGTCYRPVQGGVFSTRAAPVATTLRQMGVSGIGQSSWGPSVFAWLPGESRAHEAAEELRRRLPAAQILVTAPDNCGVQASHLPAHR